jgi:hypothetical protein
MSRAEAAARAYPDDTRIPPERMDAMRRVLQTTDDILFSEDAVAKATEAAYESIRPRMGFPTGIQQAPEGIRKDYETITRAVIAALKENARG